jgi:hypothetical protein
MMYAQLTVKGGRRRLGTQLRTFYPLEEASLVTSMLTKMESKKAFERSYNCWLPLLFRVHLPMEMMFKNAF